GGFYLGSIGGAAANLAEHCIKKVGGVENPELGMEASWRIGVVDFPAFIIIDDKGNGFFKELNLGGGPSGWTEAARAGSSFAWTATGRKSPFIPTSQRLCPARSTGQGSIFRSE